MIFKCTRQSCREVPLKHQSGPQAGECSVAQGSGTPGIMLWQDSQVAGGLQSIL